MDTPGQLKSPPAVRKNYREYATAERAAIVRYAERTRETYANVASKWNIPKTTFAGAETIVMVVFSKVRSVGHHFSQKMRRRSWMPFCRIPPTILQ